MKLNLLKAIVRVRAELLSSKCCKDFTASPKMLKKTSYRTTFMPYVPFIPVGRIVMTWIWGFSCNVSMKNILKFGFFGLFPVLFGFTLKCRSGNPDLSVITT
jgi:hypothetical protein